MIVRMSSLSNIMLFPPQKKGGRLDGGALNYFV